MYMYIYMYIYINDSKLKIYRKSLFRKWKTMLPNVESLNVISATTGTNCILLGDKTSKQIPKLNLMLLSPDMGKTGFYMFYLYLRISKNFCCGFGNSIKVSASHLSNSMLSFLDIKISVAVFLRMITAYASV